MFIIAGYITDLLPGKQFMHDVFKKWFYKKRGGERERDIYILLNRIGAIII